MFIIQIISFIFLLCNTNAYIYDRKPYKIPAKGNEDEYAKWNKYADKRTHFHMKRRVGCIINRRYRYHRFFSHLLLDKLQQITRFFEMYANDIILDGLLGLRIAEGQLKLILREVQKSNSFYEKVLQQLKYLEKVSEEVYSSNRRRVNITIPPYLPSLKKAYLFQREWRNIKRKLKWEGNNSVTLDAKDFAQCVSALQRTDGRDQQCSIPDHCFYVETVPNTEGYYTTHQALYFILAENIDCHDAVVRRLGGQHKLERFFNVWLANIHSAMLSSVKRAGFSSDLFAEQGTLCGMLGGVECFRNDWAALIFRSINNMGCVLQNDGIYEKRGEQEEGLCSVHHTSVALGYLSNLLRFVLSSPSCEMLQ